MTFTFNTYKGRREYGYFRFHEESKNILINSIRGFEEKTPIEKAKSKISSALQSSFKIQQKTANETVDEYKYMNGIILLNPEYVAAVLAMEIIYKVRIKKINDITNEVVINKNYFTENGAWDEISKNLKKSKKSNSKESILKMQIEMLNYALKMHEYMYSSRNLEIISKKSNDDIEKEYAKSIKDNENLSIMGDEEEEEDDEEIPIDEFDEDIMNDQIDTDYNVINFNAKDIDYNLDNLQTFDEDF